LALGLHLTQQLDFAQGPMSLSRISGGQSYPTCVVSYPDGAGVLRKKPAGPTLPSAHAVGREFKVLSALSATSASVAKALFYEADPAVMGTSFYVMEKLEGRVFIADRARAGTAADANAARTGQLAVNFARRAHALALSS
jgi:aminoglycoside phosphotransferase (APT) family kinase protein